MILVIFKFIHVATIALWSGGLVALPFIYVQRRGLTGDALHNLHAFARHFYVALVSPAAFVAIGSGTVLIFMQGTFVPWFSLKMLLVAVMTGIHIFSGLMILKLFEPGRVYPVWRFVIVTSLTVAVVGGILALVLGKPVFGRIEPLERFFAPGALPDILTDILPDMLGDLIAWAR